jgi:hypothetical protein
MHCVNHLEKFILLLVLYIGVFSSVLNADVEERDPDILAREHKVFVEPTYIEVSKTKNEFKLESYKKRRHDWGFTFSADYSTYVPENYEPAFAKANYKDVYGQPTFGMMEGVFVAKKNYSAFSFGGELGVSSFRNDHSDPAYVGSVLNLTSVRLGGVVYMDMIYDEPMFVPYISGGGYMMIFKESLQGNAFGGTTQIAPYANGGVAMQLDWLDPRSARIGYEESGVLTSYIFLEARKYFVSGNKKDPDFSNSVSEALGFRVEF